MSGTKKSTRTAISDPAIDKQHLYQIVAKSADAMLVVDQAGVVKFANPAAGVLLNRKSGNLIGEPFGFSIISGSPAELSIPQASGSVATAEMRAVAIQWRGEQAYLVTLRDITYRKLIETTLVDREKMLSGLISSVKDAVIVINDKGLISDLNPAAEKMFLREAKELLNAPFDLLIPAANREQHSSVPSTT